MRSSTSARSRKRTRRGRVPLPSSGKILPDSNTLRDSSTIAHHPPLASALLSLLVLSYVIMLWSCSRSLSRLAAQRKLVYILSVSPSTPLVWLSHSAS